MRDKLNTAFFLSAALCAPLAAAADGLEGEFLEPESVLARPVVELSLPLSGMSYEPAAAQLDRAREMGAGCALLTVGTADAKIWDLLAA